VRAVGRGVKGEAIAKKLEGAELVDLPVDVRPLRVPFFFFSSVLSTSVSLSLSLHARARARAPFC
jgi:hypothetical protein